MPETFTGPDPGALLARARRRLGDDAVVLALEPAGDGALAGLRLTAAAAHERRTPAPPDPALTAFAPRCDGRLVIALVGPTGAGKTTTIAKLANHPGVFPERRVGLLSLDTYRVGAVEQSRIYADLSQLPLEVVFAESELPRALARLAGCDVVLVDTAGRSPAQRDDLAATRLRLRGLAPDEVHLVIPAGLRPAVAAALVDAHAAAGVTHLLPSKLDECPGDRTVRDLADRLGLPVRWAADGQAVPRDLAPADAVRAPAAAGAA